MAEAERLDKTSTADQKASALAQFEKARSSSSNDGDLLF